MNIKELKKNMKFNEIFNSDAWLFITIASFAASAILYYASMLHNKIMNPKTPHHERHGRATTDNIVSGSEPNQQQEGETQKKIMSKKLIYENEMRIDTIYLLRFFKKMPHGSIVLKTEDTICFMMPGYNKGSIDKMNSESVTDYIERCTNEITKHTESTSSKRKAGQ